MPVRFFTQEPPSTDQLVRAVARFRRRRDGLEIPVGRRDSAGRWMPSPEEAQPCCGDIRRPSRAYPNNLYHHCRTAEHVAWLEQVSALALRSHLAREAARKRPAWTAPCDLCLACGSLLEWGCEHHVAPRHGLTLITSDRADMARHTLFAPSAS